MACIDWLGIDDFLNPGWFSIKKQLGKNGNNAGWGDRQLI
jgi:hypothetical protein